MFFSLVVFFCFKTLKAPIVKIRNELAIREKFQRKDLGALVTTPFVGKFPEEPPHQHSAKIAKIPIDHDQFSFMIDNR